MKRLFILSLLIIMNITNAPNMFADDYASMWKKIEQLNKEDKPKSVIEEAEKVLSKAKKENNFAELLKAQICITEKQCDLDPELFKPEEYEKLIVGVENDKKLSAQTKAGQLAVLHCMLASAYKSMMDSYVHDFDQETREQFPAKAKEHSLAALSDMETLSHIDNSEYKELINHNEDSRLFNHDLLNTLLDYCMEGMENRMYLRFNAFFNEEESIELYDKAIKVYDSNNNRNAATLLRLKVLEIRRGSRQKTIRLNEESYREQLQALHIQTQDIETGADVDLALANVLTDDERLNFVRTAITKWAESQHINNFKNIEANIMARHISVSSPINIVAGKPFDFTFKYTNCNTATVSIREYAGTTPGGEFSLKGRTISTYHYEKTLDQTCQSRKNANMSYSFEAKEQLTLPVGHYIITAETKGDTSAIELQITSLRLIQFSLPNSNYILATVLDNETGRPVAGASIFCFKGWRVDYGTKPTKTFKTDANGQISIPIANGKNENYSQMIAVRDITKYGTPTEDCTSRVNVWRSYDLPEKKEHDRCHIFTDRSIYRPGQTVNISVIKYHQKADEVTIVPNADVTIEIKDTKYKTVATITQTTNELGSASFEFNIPLNSNLGRYSIRVKDDYSPHCSFNVEEYKRPTFDVNIDKERNSDGVALNSRARIIGCAMSFADVPISGAEVKYTIEWSEYSRFWRWHQNWRYLLQDETTTLDSGDFVIDFPTSLPEEVDCDSITFRINVEVTDINGEMQRTTYTFNASNPDYKDNSDKLDEPKDEFIVSSDEISESQDVTVTFKACEKDALVHYYIISNQKIEHHDTKTLNGNELRFNVKYKKEWGDGVNILLFYVRNGHCYKMMKSLTYKVPEKTLKLEWTTFRDKLQPGQQEEWTLTVKDHQNKVVSGAELLAVMYDASLDNIKKHDWNFKLTFDRLFSNPYYASSNGNDQFSFYLSPKPDSFTSFERHFDIMKEFEHQRWYRIREREEQVLYSMAASDARVPRMMAKSAPMAAAMAENAIGESEIKDESATGEATLDEQTPSEMKTMRSNLTELAFFMPHVTTDSKGEAHLSFTLPDCLTEWKFMGFVHTKDMDYGTITSRATAKKDFMVQPNMPRFLRTGDKAVITAKLINMCDENVKGKATLRILEAESEAEVYSTEADFNVASGQSEAISFKISDQLTDGDYICEITATNGVCNDGERNRLPILSTKVDVVENVPFYLTEAGSKNVDLTAIFNQGSPSATDKKISIGYTDNPAIPVFKSLRALQNPKHDNAPCYAAALYSNLVLLDMSTDLSDYLEDFDAAVSKAHADKALEKLNKLQLSSGAWSWFEGMQGSYYITLTVAEDLHRLQSYFTTHDGKAPAEVDRMLKKALRYLDKEELRRYNERKKHKSTLRPYDDDLRYLAIATNADKEMVNTYLDHMVKDFKNLTIYGRSQGVAILEKYNRPKEASRFLESVKEYTVTKEGFGRYFATDLAYYSWMDYRIPTQLAAMRVIKDKDYLLDMQLWLLRQKQTQTWDNPINAIDIADFLLTNDSETALHEVTRPTLVLDGKSVAQDSVYAVEAVQELQVRKTSPGVSWGHVRSEFKEEVNNLQAYSSGELSIERKVIRNGNKVTIRHIIHADRDMDFVSVKSEHAASLEPLHAVSGYQMLGGRGGYLEIHDSYINVFFDKFTRGTTTIDMDYYIAREGEYNTGHASVECSYAPEFGSHTAGNILNCDK